LLLAPQVVLNRVHHVEVDTQSVLVARVLGARHLTQAALSDVNPSPEVLARGVWVDIAYFDRSPTERTSFARATRVTVNGPPPLGRGTGKPPHTRVWPWRCTTGSPTTGRRTHGSS